MGRSNASKELHPYCPLCNQQASWRHDNKNRWWCARCRKAYTVKPKDILDNLAKGKETAGTNPIPIQSPQPRKAIKSENEEHKVVTRGKKFRSSLVDRLIRRKAAARRGSGFLHKKRSLLNHEEESDDNESGDDGEDTSGEEGDDEDEEARLMRKMKKQAAHEYKSRQPIHACGHTNRLYYAKGMCRPCYSAKWRLRFTPGVFTGIVPRTAREQAEKSRSNLRQTRGGRRSTEYLSEDEEDGPMHKRLKSLSDDDEMDIDDIYPRILCQEEKILVPLHTIQQIAFKLNKATDAETILSLLYELSGYAFTADMLRHSHIVLVVKRLTQNPLRDIATSASSIYNTLVEVPTVIPSSSKLPPLHLPVPLTNPPKTAVPIKKEPITPNNNTPNSKQQQQQQQQPTTPINAAPNPSPRRHSANNNAVTSSYPLRGRSQRLSEVIQQQKM